MLAVSFDGAVVFCVSYQILQGDALTVLRTLPAESAHCCVTSPPYWGLRDYGTASWTGGLPDCDHIYNHGTQGATGQRVNRTFTAQAVYRDTCRKCGAKRVDQQLGLEPTMGEYLGRLVAIFREVGRVLRNDGTLWLNMGDSYCSDAGTDRKPTTLSGPRVPSGWTNRSQPTRIHAARNGKDCDPKRGLAAEGQPLNHDPALKPKDLALMPARVAIALQEDGWWVRSDIIWHKPNPMPESVTDRPTKAHEYIFLLSKSQTYYYDYQAILEPVTGLAHHRGSGVNPKAKKWPNAWSAEPGRHDEVGNGRFRPKQNGSYSAAIVDVVEDRNKRSVWTVPTFPFPEAHFATFPPALILPCILAGCPEGGTVLDPFAGACTTGLVAEKWGRNSVLIELKPEYVDMGRRRLENFAPLFREVTQVNIVNRNRELF